MIIMFLSLVCLRVCFQLFLRTTFPKPLLWYWNGFKKKQCLLRWALPLVKYVLRNNTWNLERKNILLSDIFYLKRGYWLSLSVDFNTIVDLVTCSDGCTERCILDWWKLAHCSDCTQELSVLGLLFIGNWKVIKYFCYNKICTCNGIYFCHFWYVLLLLCNIEIVMSLWSCLLGI